MLLQTSCRRLASARLASMPLRAKILNPAMRANGSSSPSSRQNFSSSFARSDNIPLVEQPGDEADDVLFESQYGVRSITLNRPKKLNSLNGSMCRKIIPRMREWSKSQMANVVVIKGNGRAFCAGGDVAALAIKNQEGPAGQQESKDYFALEYKLDHMIATYNKPYVAFIDGITMGGGVGLSINAPFRIATENTVFAMPETTIGFFPDVGASFFLPRMDGQLGMYLALTSEQVKGVNVFYAGIATHYLHSTSLPDLEARMAELQFNDYDTLDQRLSIVNRTIEEFATGIPADQPVSAPVGGNVRAAIDYVFQPAHDSVEKCLGALDGLAGMSASEAGGEEVSTWAKQTRKKILQRSPTSVRVTFRQLRRASRWGIAETFVREHRIASKFMEHPDFVEGVSALLIEKRKNPSWNPSSLEEVSEADVDAFLPATVEEPMQLLNTGEGTDYHDYPHATAIGLPRERDVQAYVTQAHPKSLEEVVQHFITQSGGKQGVKEKVGEVLERKASVEGGRVSYRN